MSATDDRDAAEARVGAQLAAALDGPGAPDLIVGPSPHDVHHAHELTGRAIRDALAERDDRHLTLAVDLAEHDALVEHNILANTLPNALPNSHPNALADAGETHDAPDGVRIGDEVLTEGAARTQAMSVEKFGDVAVRECHGAVGAISSISRRRHPTASAR